jgi:hypothetical protein
MVDRENLNRQRNQVPLWSHLNERAEALNEGPEELTPLANWLRNTNSGAEVGMLVQQLLGRLFSGRFVATKESWEAAKILVAAPRSDNLPKLAWWFISGKVKRAKRLLAEMVNNDLSAVNAIGIAVHNVVKSLQHMKLLFTDATITPSLLAEEAAERSLFAPVSLYRQATADGQIGDCPFTKNSLFVLAVGAACQQPGGRSLVFMDNTWSQCPANVWVPAMLQGVWKRALNDQKCALITNQGPQEGEWTF